jgi:hypothetical protein
MRSRGVVVEVGQVVEAADEPVWRWRQLLRHRQCGSSRVVMVVDAADDRDGLCGVPR